MKYQPTKEENDNIAVQLWLHGIGFLAVLQLVLMGY